MKHVTISANKANRLYWLGRYTERVYVSLHLLRRYYDKMIDGRPGEYEEYYKKLDAVNPYTDEDSFRLGYMYDDANPVSLISGMTSAYDNAIVLREEIMSETLSYIQLAIGCLREGSGKSDPNITDLQPVTDYLLAFWGSIDERIFDERIRNILKIGKLVENIDMHVRFGYPFYRIEEVWYSLKKCADEEKEACNQSIIKELDEILVDDQYDPEDPAYRSKVLTSVNQLVTL